jgi:zinc transporter 9
LNNRGIETLIEAHSGEETPVTKIALALLVGFSFMLLVEHASGSNSHAHGEDSTFALNTRQTPPSGSVEFDADLDGLERNNATREAGGDSSGETQDKNSKESTQRALALTLGLCIHALTDGLALGVSALSDRHTDYDSELSFVVFLALIIHKGTV